MANGRSLHSYAGPSEASQGGVGFRGLPGRRTYVTISFSMQGRCRDTASIRAVVAGAFGCMREDSELVE
jgi:hypothetical protein